MSVVQTGDVEKPLALVSTGLVRAELPAEDKPHTALVAADDRHNA